MISLYESKGRKEWVDLGKGISILLVVLFHCEEYLPIVDTGTKEIFSFFRMPFFGSSRISGAWIFRKVLNLQHENCRCNMDVPSRWLERTVRDSPVRTN